MKNGVPSCVRLKAAHIKHCEARLPLGFRRGANASEGALLAAADEIASGWKTSRVRMRRIADVAQLLCTIEYSSEAAPNVYQYFIHHRELLLASHDVVPHLHFLGTGDWRRAAQEDGFSITPQLLDDLFLRQAAPKTILRCVESAPSPSIHAWLLERWPALDLEGSEVDDLSDLLLGVAAALPDGIVDKTGWRAWIFEWTESGSGTVISRADGLVKLWRWALVANEKELVSRLSLERLDELTTAAPTLFQYLANAAPDEVAATCRSAWEVPAEFKPAYTAQGIARHSNVVAKRLLAEAAYVYSTAVDSNAMAPLRPSESDKNVIATATAFGMTAEDTRAALPLMYVAALARGLSHTPSDSLENSGIFSELLTTLNDHPDLWSELAPVLTAQGVDGDVLRVVTLSSPQPFNVAPALKRLATRSQNRSVQARAEGLARFATGEMAWHLDKAAHVISRMLAPAGTFPVPLASPSSTWLCSYDLEQHLLQRIERAQLRLSNVLPSRLGRDEEATTAELLSALALALDGIAGLCRTLLNNNVPISAVVNIEQRQPTKSEEASHGADIAFIVEVAFPNVMQAEWAELVQVKKPYREGDRAYGCGWDIDIAQLQLIQQKSGGAVYWLLDREGVVNCVPAKILGSLIDGTGRQNQGRARVGWNSIRSVAIPISEFLVKLVLGGWLGSVAPSILSVARGQDPWNLPANILTIRVTPNKPSH